MRKAIQHVLATGNEWQFAWYVTDRWQLSPRMTVNLGLRYEYYPLMSRAGGKGIERYDYQTNQMYLGGRGSTPKNAGIEVSKALFSPRAGIAYRVDDLTVIRTGFGLNYSPMPFSRPMRGQYPITVALDFQRPNTFELFRSLADGIPPVVGPDLDTGVIDVPATAGFRSPYEGTLNRGYIASWNFTVERRLPGDLITSVGYVATRSVDMLGDRDINASRPRRRQCRTAVRCGLWPSGKYQHVGQLSRLGLSLSADRAEPQSLAGFDAEGCVHLVQGLRHG